MSEKRKELVKERLNKILEEERLSKTKLGKIANLSPQSVNGWFTRGTISYAAATALSRELGYATEWIMGEESCSEKPNYPPLYISKEEDSDHKLRVEVLDVGGQCGTSGVINPDFPDTITCLYFSPEGVAEMLSRTNTNGVSLINAFGDSMTPTIKQGDLLFIDTNIKEFVGDGIYFFKLDGEGFVKRLQRFPKGKIMAMSDNKNYIPFEISGEDFATAEIVGKFIKVLHFQIEDL